MKTTLTLQPGDASEQYLRRMFSWLARIGACPKFGSRPIGWYQVHAMHALNYLEKQGGFPVRCKRGVICYKPTIGAWQPIVTPSQLFDIADSLSRN